MKNSSTLISGTERNVVDDDAMSAFFTRDENAEVTHCSLCCVTLNIYALSSYIHHLPLASEMTWISAVQSRRYFKRVYKISENGFFFCATDLFIFRPTG